MSEDRGRHFAVHEHGESTVKFDQLDFTTYPYSDNKPDGSFTEHFILQVTGAELHGTPATVPGLGSDFGMYFLIDATGHNSASGTTFGTMNIALMVDRGNNDGAPSSTADDGVTFANGTSGDIMLAKGRWYPATSSPTATAPSTRTSYRASP
jgi:hypothetical protein